LQSWLHCLHFYNNVALFFFKTVFNTQNLFSCGIVCGWKVIKVKRVQRHQYDCENCVLTIAPHNSCTRMYIHKPIMMKNIHRLALLLFAVALTVGCNHSKPKPVSNNITKTTVVVNDKKDSVINNPQKNYGTATISDPCAKLLLQNIQASDSFKNITAGKTASKLSYTLNWVKAEEPKMRANGSKITNGIEVVVNERSAGTSNKIGSYIYNNEDARLYYINNSNQYDEMNKVDTNALKQIRNGCYWGVASHK